MKLKYHNIFVIYLDTFHTYLHIYISEPKKSSYKYLTVKYTHCVRQAVNRKIDIAAVQLYKEDSVWMEKPSHHLQSTYFLIAGAVVSKRHDNQHHCPESDQHSHSWFKKKKKKKGQERESDRRDRLNISMISFEKCHKYDKHMYRPMTNALELSSSIWKMPLVLGLNLSHNPTPKKTNPNNCWRRNEAKPQLEGAAHKSHYKFHIFKYSNLICISDYVVKSDVMFADTWRFFFLPSCLFFVTLLHKSHKALTIYNIIL